MKNITFYLFFFLLLSSCSNKKKERFISSEELTDSILKKEEAADSCELQNTPPPATVDVLFEDFIYNFVNNRKFQLSRILFPIHYVNGKKESVYTKADWRFDPIYAHKEMYMEWFEKADQMSCMKRKSLNLARIEGVDFRKGSVKNYVFKKNNGLWYLTGMYSEKIEKSPNADLFKFYRNFVTSSSYRNKHLASSIKISLQDPDSQKKINGIIIPEQFLDYAPAMPKNFIYYINYNQTYKNEKERIMTIVSANGSMSSSIYMRKINGEWVVVRLENN